MIEDVFQRFGYKSFLPELLTAQNQAPTGSGQAERKISVTSFLSLGLYRYLSSSIRVRVGKRKLLDIKRAM
jgi:hypothetical protein